MKLEQTASRPIRNGQTMTVTKLNPAGRASKPVKLLESKQPSDSTVLKVKPYIGIQKEIDTCRWVENHEA
jgi:hypothetical protein